MSIPTTDEFRLAVGNGPNINRVADALEDYWTGKSGRTLTLEVNALNALIRACKEWIKLKDAKSNMKKGLFGGESGYFNTKLLDRRRHVANIGSEATKQLLMLLDNNGLIASDVRGQLSFDIRKFSEKGAHPVQRHNTKALSSGYEQERATWLATGKTKAVSGSIMHQKITSKSLGHDVVMTGAQNKAWANVQKKGGSAAEWKIVSEVNNVDLRVAYLKKAERYKYMAYIKGGLLVDVDDKPLHTWDNIWGRVTQCLWAMDRYGNMFVYDTFPVEKETGIGQVNHSSMNAGNDVICAGMIGALKGQVSLITNGSGHYKPTKQNLAEAVRILVDEGLDLGNADIVAIRVPGPRPGRVWADYYKLHPFVDCNGNCPPRLEEDAPPP